MQGTGFHITFFGIALVGAAIVVAAALLVWMFSGKRGDD
jgi:hypothetical protein